MVMTGQKYQRLPMVEFGGLAGEKDEPSQVTLSWNSINVSCKQSNKSANGSGFFSLPFLRSSRFSTSDVLSSISHTHILKNVSGICRPGELLAIMGSSGAGKTTLLDVLTHRTDDELRVSGNIFVNGARINSATLTRCSAYVQQHDLFCASLTVREQLVFQAMLRMHRHLTKEERMKRVEEVIVELGLSNCQHTMIRDRLQTTGISGGEIKRLSLACEVLTNPRLMFCDEPTSGLDSYMAQNVVATLRSMAQGGRTIVSTIHQPSSMVYAMFDRIMLMAEGRVVFLGPANEAVRFFDSLGAPCPKQHNPPEHFLDHLAVTPDKAGAAGLNEATKKLELISHLYEDTDLYRELIKDITANQSPKQDMSLLGSGGHVGSSGQYQSVWSSQFRWITWRLGRQMRREPRQFATNLIEVTIHSLMLLIFCGYQDMHKSIEANNLTRILYLLISFVTFTNMKGTILTFISERTVFLRDHQNGMYRPSAYFLAHMLVQAPIYTFAAVFFSVVVYPSLGFNPDPARFAYFVTILVLIAWSAVSYGYLCSCVAPNVTVALQLLSVISTFRFFCGFFINYSSLPVVFQVVVGLSWFRYGYAAAAIDQWEGVTNITCSEEVITCYPDGETILRDFDFDKNYWVWDFVGLVANIICYRSLAFWCLLLKTRRNTIQAAK